MPSKEEITKEIITKFKKDLNNNKKILEKNLNSSFSGYNSSLCTLNKLSDVVTRTEADLKRNCLVDE